MTLAVLGRAALVDRDQARRRARARARRRRRFSARQPAAAACATSAASRRPAPRPSASSPLSSCSRAAAAAASASAAASSSWVACSSPPARRLRSRAPSTFASQRVDARPRQATGSNASEQRRRAAGRRRLPCAGTSTKATRLAAFVSVLTSCDNPQRTCASPRGRCGWRGRRQSPTPTAASAGADPDLAPVAAPQVDDRRSGSRPCRACRRSSPTPPPRAGGSGAPSATAATRAR